MTWTPTSSPTRRAAAAPASVAAFTEPTSPRTIAVTRPGVDLLPADEHDVGGLAPSRRRLRSCRSGRASRPCRARRRSRVCLFQPCGSDIPLSTSSSFVTKSRRSRSARIRCTESFVASCVVLRDEERRRGTLLRDSPARRDRQRLDHLVAFDEPHAVDQIRDDAGMVRHDADAIARLERGRRR